MPVTINGDGSITGLAVGGLPNGTVDADTLASNSVITDKIANGAVTADKSTGSSKGIMLADQWYLTANKTSDGDLTSLARNNYNGAAAQIGDGMTQSSGVFTFPTTGKYLIFVAGRFSCNSDDNVNTGTAVTLNNGGSFTTVCYASDGNNSSGGPRKDGSNTSMYFLDVTDTSQVKVKFIAGSVGSGSWVQGNTGQMDTSFTFIRLGDT